MNPRTWLKAYLSNASLFLPAIAFLLCARIGPVEGDARWGTAYTVGGALAIVHAAWLLRSGRRHSIALGLDAYLLVGGVLALVSAEANRAWGTSFGVAPVLLCVLAVGVLGALLSPGGFERFDEGEQVSPARARAAAWATLAVTALALALAVALRHAPLFANVLLILGLVVARGALRKRAAYAR